jgi:hypothetical protein
MEEKEKQEILAMLAALDRKLDEILARLNNQNLF